MHASPNPNAFDKMVEAYMKARASLNRPIDEVAARRILFRMLLQVHNGALDKPELPN